MTPEQREQRIEAVARQLRGELFVGDLLARQDVSLEDCRLAAEHVLDAVDVVVPVVTEAEHAAVARSIKNQRDENRQLIHQLDELRGKDPANVARLKRQLEHANSHAARIYRRGRAAEEAARDFAETLASILRGGRLGGVAELHQRAHKALAAHPEFIEGASG